MFIEAIPILEHFISLIVQFLSMFQAMCEVQITKQSAKAEIVKHNVELETEKVNTHVVGFSMPNADDEEYEEDDDE